MLTVEEIRKWIDNDKNSRKKRQAAIGVRYYEGDHDIKQSRIFFINAEGKPQEDYTKTNTKIPHPFFTELVDQSTQYMLSDEDAFIRSDNPELQKELDERFNNNDHFRAELYECAAGSQIKGFEYMYAYKNEKGKTVFQCADSMGVVEVRAEETQDQCDYLIYWYVDRIDKGEKKIKRIQVWDAAQTYFYCQIDDGAIVPDASMKRNPRPHSIFKKPGDESTYYEAYGFIPFFKLPNGKKEESALNPIKKLIDDYDVMNCGLSNNIQDSAEALYVVQGFQGDNLDELMENIKAKKHIGLPEGGSVNIQTVDIPVDARKAKMELDEQNIYRFGFGLNTYGLKDTAATTNMAIKTVYSLLDLKTNKLLTQLKEFLRQLVGVALDEINAEQKTDYTQKDVYFQFKREIIINEAENAQIELTKAQTRQTEINTIMILNEQLDDETRKQLICEQLELDYNEYKDKLPNLDELAAYETQLSGIVPEDANAGDMSAEA